MKRSSILDYDLFDEILIPIVKERVHEASKSPLEPFSVYEKRKLLELKGLIKGFFNDVEDGFHYFFTHAPKECQSKLAQLIDQDRVAELIEHFSDPYFILASSIDINSNDLDLLFEMACSHQVDNLVLAKKLFSSLICLDYTEARFWLGLAYTHVEEHDFEGAKMLYVIALGVGNRDPLPYLYYAKFLSLIGDPLVARVIEEGMKRAEGSPLLAQFEALPQKGG